MHGLPDTVEAIRYVTAVFGRCVPQLGGEVNKFLVIYFEVAQLRLLSLHTLSNAVRLAGGGWMKSHA
eukprot:COSAG01_NODE_12097_length_1801_cov_8.356639_2_plen_67_part_00